MGLSTSELKNIFTEVFDYTGADTECKRKIARELISSFGFSQRTACTVVGISRNKLNPPPKKEKDLVLKEEIIRIKDQYPKYGYRRIKVSLQNKGYCVNLKKIQRLCWELFSEKKERVVIHTLRPEAQYNECWAMDYTVWHGKQIVVILDEHSRSIKFIHAYDSIDEHNLIKTLSELIKRDRPKIIVTDNGMAFNSADWELFYMASSITHQVIPKGRPQQNAFIERFNRTLKEECLESYDYSGLVKLNRHLKQWATWYNNDRPHSALGYESPNKFINKLCS